MSEAATELEERLAAACVEPVDAVRRIDALLALAWELRNSQRSRAQSLATEARELAREHGYKLGEARALRTIMMSFGTRDDIGGVFELAHEAKDLFDEVGDGSGRAAMRDFLASLYEFTGDLTGALELALEALAIAREIDDAVRAGYALANVGGVLAASGEVDEGVERLKEALQHFEEADEAPGIGSICARLCEILHRAGRHEEALHYARRCLEIAEITKAEFLSYTAYSVMGKVEQERGNGDEAERLYRASLDCFTSSPGRMLGCQTQVSLARLLFERGDIEDARRELEDALRRVEHNPVAIVILASVHEALAELYQAQGQLADTVEHLRAQATIREQIAQKEARNKLAQLEARATMETAKKDAEIHKLRFVELHGMQSKLVEAEKMAVLGKLAAGTAHELHTPLGVLRSNAKLSVTATERLVSMLRDDTTLGARAAKLANVLESCRDTNAEAMERIAAIAHSLGRFTELDQAEQRTFDVREGLESALALLAPTIPDDIELQRRFADVPAVAGWPRELNHAFLTVLQNAAEAIRGSGVVTVETVTVEEHVVVHIRDTGQGMSEEQVANLFDVAWSEDGTRVKMRLGLSAAYATMQKHGGSLEVESRVGEGTTVTFRFASQALLRQPVSMP